MNRLNNISANALFLLSLAFAAVLPFGNIFPDDITDAVPLLARIPSLIIILMGVAFLFGIRTAAVPKGVQLRGLILFAGLFLVYLAGLIYTQNLT